VRRPRGAGDFSGSDVALIDPVTGLPFPNNQIPVSRIDSAALALLKYYPLPNQPGDAKNYYRSSTTGNRSDDINVRFTKSFGRRLAREAARGRGRRAWGRRRPGGRPRRIESLLRRAVPPEPTPIATARSDHGRIRQGRIVERAGQLHVQPVGMFNTLNVQYNRARSESTNLYAYQDRRGRRRGHRRRLDGPVLVGIPALSFTSVSGLRGSDAGDPHGSNAHGGHDPDEAVQAACVPLWRRLPLDAQRQPDRQQPARQLRVHGALHGLLCDAGRQHAIDRTALDFADFLLGMSQQATLNYGPA